MTKSTKSKRNPRSTAHSAATDAGSTDQATEHYHREKMRRAVRSTPESDAMAAARREYLALLESDAAKGKGGRPRKKTAAPVGPVDEANEDAVDD